MEIHTLKEWIDAQTENHECGDIWRCIAAWIKDSFDHETPDYYTIKNVVRHLETADCAACHAPSGLIYNYDIARKVPDWWNEIDNAIAEYHEATGEHLLPRNGESISIGFLVWFAVEWKAREFARILESNAGDGVIVENV